MAKKNKLDLRPLINDFKKARRSLPKTLGQDAVLFFKDSFRKQGFQDRTVSLWAKRSERTKKLYNKRGQKFDNAKTLVLSGYLKNSIKRLSTSFSRIKIGTEGADYANIHNEGGNGKMYGHPFKMPKRQFIGNSYVLEKALKKRIEKEISIFTKRLT